MSSKTLHVRIISPFQTFLDAEAQSVSSKNTEGSFDILADHANFLTMIENSPITVRFKNEKAQTFNFPLAIILTSSNKVNIYIYSEPKLEK